MSFFFEYLTLKGKGIIFDLYEKSFIRMIQRNDPSSLYPVESIIKNFDRRDDLSQRQDDFHSSSGMKTILKKSSLKIIPYGYCVQRN